MERSTYQRTSEPGAGTPHTFWFPAPPQVWPAGQLPQASVPPQPSAMEPQSFPCAAQVVGVHGAGPQVRSEVHTWPVPQAPQSIVAPQPSGIVPHVFPCAAQVVGLQVDCGVPHALAVPAPPQVCPCGQEPHSRAPPHPSPACPHVAFSDWQVAGVQVGSFPWSPLPEEDPPQPIQLAATTAAIPTFA